MPNLVPDDLNTAVTWIVAAAGPGLMALLAGSSKFFELLFGHHLNRRMEAMRQRVSRELAKEQRLREGLGRSLDELKQGMAAIASADAEDAYALALPLLKAMCSQAPALVPELMERLHALAEFLEQEDLLREASASAAIAREFERLSFAIQAYCLSPE